MNGDFMKILSIFKSVLSEDMNLFKYKSKINGTLKILLPILLFIFISFSIGGSIYFLSEDLAKYHLTYVIISLILILATFMIFIEGILKSQSMLFDCKDNDLLFSLPIKRSTILFIRIIKLLLFEFLFSLMFLLPTFIVYIIFEQPCISHYFLYFIIILLTPIIPTILSCFIGYIIKLISSKMRFKNIIQALLTSLLFFVMLFLGLKSDSIMNTIVKNATSINDVITKIYYPVGLCIKLINDFNILDFIKLLLINIIIFIVFIIIGQKYYFKIISNSKNKIKNIKKYNVVIKSRKPIISLTIKELKRYFSSPSLIFNSSFGLIFLIIFTIIFCFKENLSVIDMLSSYGISKDISIKLLYYGFLFLSLMMTSITSSSISLEGKTINITKSLPIDYRLVFKAKIINCFIIELPLVLISIVLFTIFYKISILFVIQLLVLTFLSILLNAVTGLIINLHFPKLNANNDTEIVKQGMSTLLSLVAGIGILIINILVLVLLYNKLNIYLLFSINLSILLIFNILLYRKLMKKGPLMYQNLDI